MSQSRRNRSTPAWTDEHIRRELQEFLQGASEWPSYRDFQRAGRNKLRDEVTRAGGARLWAERLGLPYPERRPGYAPIWTEERVRADLREFLRGWERWPSRLEFEAAGRKPLRDAVRRLGGPERWAAEFGLSLQNLKLRFGLATAVAQGAATAYWASRFGFPPPPQAGTTRPRLWTDDRIRGELEEFCRGRSTWPTEREFLAAGKSKLYNAACHYGGTRHWAAQLGVVRTRRHGPSSGSRPTVSHRSHEASR